MATDTRSAEKMRTIARVILMPWLLLIFLWIFAAMVGMFSDGKPLPPVAKVVCLAFGAFSLGSCLCVLAKDKEILGGVLIVICGILLGVNLIAGYKIIGNLSEFPPELPPRDFYVMMLIFVLPPLLAGILLILSRTISLDLDNDRRGKRRLK